MIETKTIKYNEFTLNSRCFYNDKSTVHFSLSYSVQLEKEPILVLACRLDSLKNAESAYSEGDYYQGHIQRKNKDVLPNVSFVAVFQEILRIRSSDIPFIHNVYSTALDGADGFSISHDAINFWNKQLENNLAEWIECKGRFKAKLE